MTFLSKIDSFSHGGVLGDYKWPSGLAEFRKLNLVFGWNGSGKTSLSRMLRSLELREKPSACEAHLSFGGDRLRSSDFPSSNVGIKVFNRQYVDDVVRGTQNEGAPYILVVGPENGTRQELLKRSQARKKSLSDFHDRAATRVRAAGAARDEWLVARAVSLKESTRKLGGTNRFANLNKRSYADESRKYEVGEFAAQALLSPERERELQDVTTSKRMDRIDPLPTYSPPALDDAQARAKVLLGRTALSSVIARFAEDADLEAWAKTGLALHRRHGADACLFCESKLPVDRLAELEAHFSEAYAALEDEIDAEIETLSALRRTTYASGLPGEGSVYADLLADYRSATAKINAEDARVNAALTRLAEVLEAKKKAMNTVQTIIDDETEDVDGDLAVGDQPLADMVNCLTTHNERSDAFESTAAGAKDELAAAYFCAGLPELAVLESDFRELAAQSDEIEGALSDINATIKALEAELAAHLRPAAELNGEIRAYLGHAAIEFVDAGTGYILKNRDAGAEYLSDGEKTAIALLYFLKTLEDDSMAGAMPIVVLDDPISSLDENSIYSAFGFIKHRTKSAGQLFVLTHNYTFFTLVRNWMKQENKRTQGNTMAGFYMLDRVSSEAVARSQLAELDPLLRDHESDYHYLWACLAREAASSTTRPYADYYAYPNMARRLLESFLFFRFPAGGELSAKVMQMNYDASSKETALRFLQGYSHSGGRLDSEQDLSLLAETRSILRVMFDMMREEDSDHFRRMQKATSSPRIPSPLPERPL